MEHVIQIGVHIDDEAIQERILSSAEKQILSEIKADIEKTIIEKHNPYYGKKVELSLSGRAEAIIKEWLDENAETVVNNAAKLISEKVYRSKAWKEKYGEVTEND